MRIIYKTRAARYRVDEAWGVALQKAGIPAEQSAWTEEQKGQAKALRERIAAEMARTDPNIVVDGVQEAKPMLAVPFQPETPGGTVRWTQGDACPVCQRAVEAWSEGVHPAPAVPGSGDPRQIRTGGVRAGAVLMPCGHWADLVLPPGTPRASGK